MAGNTPTRCEISSPKLQVRLLPRLSVVRTRARALGVMVVHSSSFVPCDVAVANIASDGIGVSSLGIAPASAMAGEEADEFAPFHHDAGCHRGAGHRSISAMNLTPIATAFSAAIESPGTCRRPAVGDGQPGLIRGQAIVQYHSASASVLARPA